MKEKKEQGNCNKNRGRGGGGGQGGKNLLPNIPSSPADPRTSQAAGPLLSFFPHTTHTRPIRLVTFSSIAFKLCSFIVVIIISFFATVPGFSPSFIYPIPWLLLLLYQL